MKPPKRLPPAAVPTLPVGHLRWVVWMALACLLLLALPLPTWQRVIAFIPLVLVLPGFALTAAVFPRRPPLEETFVYTIAFSFCAAAIGGVLTQLVLPLSRTVWGLLLVLITLCAAGAADRRDAALGLKSDPLRMRLPGVAATLMLAAALTIGCASVVLATNGAQDEAAKAHFTELWIVPSERVPGKPGATVGVRNQEGHASSFSLGIANGRGAVKVWQFELEEGATRTFELGPWSAPGPGATVAALNQHGKPIRSVHLEPETTR